MEICPTASWHLMGITSGTWSWKGKMSCCLISRKQLIGHTHDGFSSDLSFSAGCFILHPSLLGHVTEGDQSLKWHFSLPFPTSVLTQCSAATEIHIWALPGADWISDNFFLSIALLFLCHSSSLIWLTSASTTTDYSHHCSPFLPSHSTIWTPGGWK